MFIKKIAGTGAAVLVVGATAFAQSTNPAPSAQNESSAQADSTRQMTIAGCLINEAEYRQGHGLGQGALSGAGLGDEFVLVDIRNEPGTAASNAAANTAPSTTAAAPSASAETCTDTGNGPAYRLTGSLEDKLKAFVGHRIEVTGKFDHRTDAQTAAGLNVAKLPPEFEIASYREAPASTTAAAPPSTVPAPPPVSQPPAATTSQTPAPSSTGTSGQTPSTTAQEERRMPKTASNLPLVALLGALSLSAGFGLRAARRRAL